MDPMNEEQLDYGEEEYEGGYKSRHDANGVISTLSDDLFRDDGDDFGDLYDDVNIVSDFAQTFQRESELSVPSKTKATSGRSEDHGKDVPGPLASQNTFVPGVTRVENNPRINNVYQMTPEQVSSASVVDNGQHKIDPSPKTNAPLENPIARFGSPGLPSMAHTSAVHPTFPSDSSVIPTDQKGIVGSYPAMNDASGLAVGAVISNGPTSLLVGDLHWWTTDADVENAASQFGRVKEVKFFDERASGKSKGYCQVDFYDPAAAALCVERMNGQVFNGRACAVSFANAQTLKNLGASYTSRNQNQSQGRGNMNDGNGRNGYVNYQGGDGGRGYGRGGWGRGAMNRGQGGGGPIRGRGTNGGGGSGMMGGPYGQGFGGPGFGGPAGAMMHPQNMIGAGFDPGYMGRGGGAYVGFTAPTFPGMMPQFAAVNPMGIAGVAPHVNPAFIGRGMTPNGMGMMGSGAMNENLAGPWMNGGNAWTGNEQAKGKQSSYVGDEDESEYGSGEATNAREGRSKTSQEDKDSRRDERERDSERSNKYKDSHRQRDRQSYDDDGDRDRGEMSSRSQSRSQLASEENRGYHSRDRDYSKRRRE